MPPGSPRRLWSLAVTNYSAGFRMRGYLRRRSPPRTRLRSRFPCEQPIQADIERVGDVAKPVKGQVDCCHREIAASIRRKARAFSNLLRRKAPRAAGIHKAVRELRYVRHLVSPLDQVSKTTN